jgi:hypothetical protein
VVRFMTLILFGIAVAACVAWLVGLAVPWLRGWVFIGLSIWWVWTGWRYASIQDRIERARRSAPFN